MENYSRRSFLMGAALTGAGAALGSLAFPAVAQAKEWESDDAIDVSKVSREIDADVVVCGGGLSGLAAAVQAAESGDKVVLIEAQSSLGGNGLGVEGTCAYGLEGSNSEDISMGEVIAYELERQQHAIDARIWRDLLSNTADNINWLLENGVQIEPKNPDFAQVYNTGRYAQRFSFEWTYAGGKAGVGYVPPMTDKLGEYGARILLNTRGMKLKQEEDGAITGIYAIDEFGDTLLVHAKAIILACGGFANNETMMAQYGLDMENVRLIGTPGHFGDGVKMALEVGGVPFGQCAFGMTNIIGNTSDPWGVIYQHFSYGGPSLWVTKDGERFADEAASLYSRNFEEQSIPIRLQGGTCWAVMDQSVFDYMAEGNDEAIQAWNNLIKTNDGVYKADTIEELAQKIGVNQELFVNEFNLYNEMCKQGKDDLFGKDKEYLLPMGTPPFYAGKITMACEGTYCGGVKTDRSYRVVLPNGKSKIDNVFVIGTDGTMIWNNLYSLEVGGTLSAHHIYSGRTAAKAAHELISQS